MHNNNHFISRVFSQTGIAGLIATTSVLIAFIVRLILWITTPASHDASLLEQSGVFAIGLLMDSMTAVFMLAFLCFWRLFCPGFLLRHWTGRLLGFLWLYVGLFVLIATAVAEWLFWQEFSSRFNFISVDYMVYRREVTDNISESYPLPLIVSAVAIVSLVVSLAWMRATRGLSVLTPWRKRAGVFLASLAATVGLGFLNADALRNVSDNRYERELAANGIYQFFSAFNNNQLEFATFYSTLDRKEAARHLAGALGISTAQASHDDITRAVTTPKPEQHLNVMLVVVESLSAEFLGAYGNKKGLTPQLDALAAESLVFDQLYATGSRTVRGLEAISLSIPPTPGHSIVKRKHNEHFYNISTEFNRRGYASNFIYGGYGYFDNMNPFFGNNGFTIVDRHDFADGEVHFANAWGVSDEDLFAKAIQRSNEANKKGKPFFNLVMTTSNHRPFTYPDNRVSIPSGDGREGAVQYTDYAIGKLISDARQQPWFDNTVFVIIADHCAGVAGRTELPMDDYHIPLIVYSPGHIQPRHVPHVASQMDLAPTLLGLLDFSYESQFFGRDALSPEAARDPRALLATYESLGLYRQGILSVIEPRQVSYQILDPLGQQRVSPIVDDALLKDTISLYQAADHVYREHLTHDLEPPSTIAQHPTDVPAEKRGS